MKEAIENIIQKVDEGSMNPLDAMIELKKIKSECDLTLSRIKAFESEFLDDITFEAGQYPEGYKGFLFEIRNGRRMYDYSNIEEVVEAENQVKELKEYYKQAFISRQKNILTANEDGEEIPLPELKISKSSIVLKEIRK